MPLSRREFLRLTGMTAAGLGIAEAIQWQGIRPVYAAETGPMIHVLNRLTWGPRPQDVEKIKKIGIEAFIDLQLNPSRILDPLIDDFMKNHPVLSMGFRDLAQSVMRDPGKILKLALWARVYRAITSERQLFELLVEFWTDHFNIPIPDLIPEKIIDDRDVVRKYAMSKFRDLLFASAQSPAMLRYLNNADSNKEHPNENYARELMELHTLGVDGGYTEIDVKEVARAFTGWTVRESLPNGFYFNPDDHDDGEKVILGHKLPAKRGIEDGLEVLDILATHPSTAKFITSKLCRRFVSDSPPQSLLDSAARVFASTDGDIPQIMKHIFTSSEFMASPNKKFRRPLDFVVALMRITRATLDEPTMLGDTLEAMGQLPYFWHPPNGYPDAAGAWANASGLLNRWNLALNFMDGAVTPDETGIRIPFEELITPAKDPAELVDNMTALVLQGAIDPQDRDQLIAFVSNDGKLDITSSDLATRTPTLIALLMSSPYFQWH